MFTFFHFLGSVERYDYGMMSSSFLMNPFSLVSLGGVFMTALIIWTLAWKGLALWKAAHREEKGWFIALLVLNTLGILDILYLYVFSNGEKKGAEEIKIEEVKS